MSKLVYKLYVTIMLHLPKMSVSHFYFFRPVYMYIMYYVKSLLEAASATDFQQTC